MMPCSQCGKDLDENQQTTLKASISGSIMGDETTESYFLCPHCGAYTLEIFHDRFCGEPDVRYEGPVSPTAAAQRITLIEGCETPWDKKCRCQAHKTYFDDWLD
jgi:hypothetical protein